MFYDSKTYSPYTTAKLLIIKTSVGGFLCIFAKNFVMTKLSVNINKIATIRNARGGNTPNVVQVAIDCERFWS